MLWENPEYKALDLESARAIIGMLGVKMKLDTVKEGDEGGEVYDIYSHIGYISQIQCIEILI